RARVVKGRGRWGRLGGITLRPGEFAKVTLCIFLASYLVEKRELLSVATHRLGPAMVPDLKHFGPILLAWGLSLVVLIAERDLGSSLLFFALFVAMIWVATARGAYLVIGAGLFVAGSFFTWPEFAHVHDRVRVGLQPWPSASAAGVETAPALRPSG